MTAEDRNEELQAMFQKAVEIGEMGKRKEAIALLKKVHEKAGHGVLQRASGQAMAAYLAEEGDDAAAYQVLQPYKKGGDSDQQRLYQEVAYRLGKWDESREAGIALFREEPYPDVAVLVALCNGRLGAVGEAISWLEASREAGIADFDDLLASPDFDSIRGDPRFQNYLNRS